MDLTELIDQFLSERNQLGLMSIARVSGYRNDLVGTSRAFDRIGFVRFLKDLGITSPSTAEFNSHYLGRYWEYLTQHYGVIYSGRAMKTLRVFWKWCAANNYVYERRMPPDLKTSGVARPYKVAVKVTETN